MDWKMVQYIRHVGIYKCKNTRDAREGRAEEQQEIPATSWTHHHFHSPHGVKLVYSCNYMLVIYTPYTRPLCKLNVKHCFISVFTHEFHHCIYTIRLKQPFESLKGATYHNHIQYIVKPDTHNVNRKLKRVAPEPFTAQSKLTDQSNL